MVLCRPIMVVGLVLSVKVTVSLIKYGESSIRELIMRNLKIVVTG